MQIIANAYCRIRGHRSDGYVPGYPKKFGRDVYYKCARCGKDFLAYREDEPALPPSPIVTKEEIQTDATYDYNPVAVEAVRTAIRESAPKITSGGGGDFLGGGAEEVFTTHEMPRWTEMPVQEESAPICRRNESPTRDETPSYSSRDDDSRTTDSGSSSSSDSGSYSSD